MSEEIPFYMDQIIVHKRGSDELMQVSKHIPPGRNVQFDQSLKYPEGTWNILTLTFKVNKPLKGVVCHRKVYKHGLCVNTEDEPIGDFEPREEVYKHIFPEVESPSGFFVRGNFSCALRFTDGDGKEIYTITYPFEICKKDAFEKK